MSELAKNLGRAWEDRANREAALPTYRAPALFKPEECERNRADFRRAVAWFRYWTGRDAA